MSVPTDFLDTMPASVAAQFWERVRLSPDSEAFRYPQGEDWASLTWGEAGERVGDLAAGLLSLGIESEQRVGIASNTRYEWVLADLAIMCAGAATTTVYPTTNEDDTAYILSDSECRVVFAEDADQLAKLQQRRSDLGRVDKVVLLDGDGDGDWVISLSELEELGRAFRAEHPDRLQEVADSITPDQLATLIYTSGTTGRPKGVRLRHRSWVYEGEAVAAQRLLTQDDLEFRWLPMSHSLGKVLMATQMACGYPCAIDGRIDKIVENAGVIRPTFMGAPPRIFEKAHSKIVMMQASEGGAKEKIFNKAFEVGLQVRRLQREGKSVPLPLRLQHGLFDRLVFSKIRERFGGRIRFFISGAAALNQDIAEWFDVAGLTILEGYGLTETAAGSFVNLPEDNRLGTVGPVFPGSEVKIDESGEILFKGPGVMDGYHNRPEETAEALTEDGWLRTGDKGELDADGYLRITGRIKELFKTSGGKYIAPPLLESKFKALCPYASQFLVFGDERNFVVALITVDPEAIAGWAQDNGVSGDYAQIVASEECRAMIGEYVDKLNAQLNRWETVKKWELLDHDLSVESGEMTPSMKVKRNVVEQNYADKIDAFYS